MKRSAIPEAPCSDPPGLRDATSGLHFFVLHFFAASPRGFAARADYYTNPSLIHTANIAPLKGWPANGKPAAAPREALNKAFPFMVRQALQPHSRRYAHERKQELAVRPEPVEGLNQRFPRLTVNPFNQIFYKWKFIILVSIVSTLSGCPLTVNLNVVTDKPISLNVVVDKPIEVKLGAEVAVAVTKLPPIKVGVQ